MRLAQARRPGVGEGGERWIGGLAQRGHGRWQWIGVVPVAAFSEAIAPHVDGRAKCAVVREPLPLPLALGACQEGGRRHRVAVAIDGGGDGVPVAGLDPPANRLGVRGPAHAVSARRRPAVPAGPVAGFHGPPQGAERDPVRRRDAPSVATAGVADDPGGVAGQIVNAGGGQPAGLLEVDLLGMEQLVLHRRTRARSYRSGRRCARRGGRE